MLTKLFKYSIVASLLLTCSCLKEDVSRCGAGVWVQYYYTLNPQRVNLFAEQVHQMGIFIFDHQARYYDYQLISDPAQFQNQQPIRLNLPVGDYTLVSWGGTPNWYAVGECPNGAPFQPNLRKGVTSLTDFRLWIQWYRESGSDQAIAKEPADLYFGESTYVEVRPGRKTHVDIGLTKDTHLLNITITGIQFFIPMPTPTTSPLDTYCISANGRYKYDNTFDPSAGTVKYLPSNETFGDNRMQSEIKVMRLMPETPAYLTIANRQSGEIYYHFDLLSYIMQSPSYATQQDLDREEVFDIKLDINMDLTVSVLINGWQVTNVIPQ
ncbi:MAG: FimB/Mfa2 family fimbrial subunit [Alistipes sp.]